MRTMRLSVCTVGLACQLAVPHLLAETPGSVSVAIYDASKDGRDKVAQAPLIAALLRETEGISVALVGDLKLSSLLPHQVLILPDDPLGEKGRDGLAKDVPAYVEAGGGFLSCAQGARCIGGGYPPASIDPLMPSICSFAADLNFLRDSKTLGKKALPAELYAVVSAGDHPITQGIDKILPADTKRWHGPVENYAMVKVGPDGERVLVHPDFPFYAAMAVGRLGGGRAAFTGMRFIFSFAAPPDEEDLDAAAEEKPKMENDREHLLLNTVRWLAQPPDAKRMVSHAQTRFLEFGGSLAKRRELIARQQERLAAAMKDVPGSPGASAAAECLAKIEKAETDSPDRTWSEPFVASVQPSREQAAAAFLKLREMEEVLRRETVSLLKQAAEVRVSLYEKAKKRPPREIPAYPRGVCHTKYRVDNVAARGKGWPERIAERYMRELSWELHANVEVGLVGQARALGKYNTNRTAWDPYAAFADAYGIALAPFTTDPTGLGLDKQNPFQTYARYPALFAFLWDEPLCFKGKGNYNHVWPNALERFRAYVKEHYQPEVLSRYRVDPKTVTFSAVVNPNAADAEALLAKEPHYSSLESMEEKRECAQALWMMAGEHFRDEMKARLSIGIQALKQADPEIRAWINLNIFPWYSYGASLLGSAEIAEILSVDPYRNGSLVEMLMMEMIRGATDAPVWGIAFGGVEYGWEMRYRRHLYNIVLPGDGLFTFSMDTMYKHQHSYGSTRPSWSDGFWDITAEVYRDIERTEQYLAGRKSIAPVAILLSERTQWGRYFCGWGGKGKGRRYEETVLSLYHDFLASHVPVDIIWAERLSRYDLSRYALIVAPAADCIQDREREVVEGWVGSGGTLLATGATSACDHFGNLRPDFAWRDLFGATRQSTKALDPKRVEKGEVAMTVSAVHPILGALKNGSRIAYRGDERELVKASSGTVLATWPDGSPGVILSQKGKGAVLYTSASSFGSEPKYYGYTWQVGPMPEGTRELLDGCVAYALKQKGMQRPVRLEPKSEDLIADLRVQETDGKRRLVLQLLQRDAAYTVDKSKAPRGIRWKGSSLPVDCLIPHEHAAVKVSLELPKGIEPAKVKVLAPLLEKELAATAQGTTLNFETPPFVQHTIIVIE